MGVKRKEEAKNESLKREKGFVFKPRLCVSLRRIVLQSIFSYRLTHHPMNILFLGYTDSPLISFLRDGGEQVQATAEKITPEFILSEKIEFIISYGYRFMLKKEILDLLPGKVINLHISYLPWNRGSDPNFWSVVENTPKGVTIHLIDEGLDTGAVLVQQEVEMTDNDTLRTSYEKLQQKLQDLFRENWDAIKHARLTPRPQKEKGTFHTSAEKERYIAAIKDKWLDIELNDLRQYMVALTTDKG